jgi:hypothetical protein
VTDPPAERARGRAPREHVVELLRAPRVEADLIVARLRASGVEAAAGPDAVYASLTFTDGVPVFVRADEVQTASEILGADDQPE